MNDAPDVPRGTPTHVGDHLHKLIEGWEAATCPCGQGFARRVGSEHGLCPPCSAQQESSARLSVEDAHIRTMLHQWMPRLLSKAGLSRRESLAEWSRVPEGLKRRLSHPVHAFTDFLSGQVPVRGFGLSGPAGVGKTFALAFGLAAHMKSRILLESPTRGMKAIEVRARWIRWPETVNAWRVTSTSEGGLDTVSRSARTLSSVEVLIIDDLGAERLKGDYNEDWAVSQLDLIVDRRYNEMLPTWYTTNMGGTELTDRYGARFYSRLCSSNPLVEAPAGPDLRVVKDNTGG